MSKIMVEKLFQDVTAAYDINQTWWLYAAFTDQIFLNEWTPSCDVENKVKDRADLLLELRVFSVDAEYRLIRGNISGKLKYRICNKDSQLKKYKDYYDEFQYLDVDTNQSKKELNHWNAKTTGGGGYLIPLQEINNIGVWIRNYLSYYEETGQAFVSDWRILKLGGLE